MGGGGKDTSGSETTRRDASTLLPRPGQSRSPPLPTKQQEEGRVTGHLQDWGPGRAKGLQAMSASQPGLERLMPLNLSGIRPSFQKD
jgi:hypothetical protein